jgi:hypothetical protein
MRLQFMRQFYTHGIRQIQLYILPVIKYYRINNNHSITLAWLAWGIIIEVSPYYHKGTFKIEWR